MSTNSYIYPFSKTNWMFPPDGHLVEPPSFLFCLERKAVNKLELRKAKQAGMEIHRLHLHEQEKRLLIFHSAA
ncbi:hypothetical protein B1A98_11725 [Bacillus badius]|nr:hypothetical protein B1A98_11725 [Bacillus badius]